MSKSFIALLFFATVAASNAFSADDAPVVFHGRFECIGALDRADHCFEMDGTHKPSDLITLPDGPVTLDRLLPSQVFGDVETKVYGGQRSVDGEFPMGGWIGNCTGNLISKGRDVLYTASHCVYNGKRISFQHRGTGRSYTATCWRHPRYNTSTIYNDYALCKLDAPIAATAVVAQVRTVSPAIGEVMILNGLGAPTAGTAHQWGKAAVKRISGQDIVTCGPANLGGGDSGGSLFADGDRTGSKGLYVLGVNSRGGGGCSYFNRNSATEFTSWAREFEQQKSVEICGVSVDCFEADEPIDCQSLYLELSECIVDSPAVPYTDESCHDKAQRFVSKCIRN